VVKICVLKEHNEYKFREKSTKISVENTIFRQKYRGIAFLKLCRDLKSLFLGQPSIKVNELAVRKIDHQNIMKHLDQTFELIDNVLSHVTGKFHPWKVTRSGKKTNKRVLILVKTLNKKPQK